jgi:hypothetical protein
MRGRASMPLRVRNSGQFQYKERGEMVLAAIDSGPVGHSVG